MLSRYKVLTITHRHASLHEIGQFVIGQDNGISTQDHLHSICRELGIEELIYLATCNRVLYFFDKKGATGPDFTREFLQVAHPGLGAEAIDALSGRFQLLSGEQALEHMFEVSASIDSLVVGEREILRQLREAYEQCSEWGLTGDNMRIAMRAIVEGAKEVYAGTRIGEKPISVVSLAMTSMMEAGARPGSRVLLIGAGQTNLLVSKFLKKWGFTGVQVFNRSIDRAQRLAQSLQGKAHSLDSLADYHGGFDILIVCTGANRAIIDKALYQSLLQGEGQSKILVDLSVPNNIARAVTEKFACQYIEIEDLKKKAEANMDFRRQEVERARGLIRNSLLEFESNFRTRQLEKAFSGIPREIKAIKQKAIETVFRKDLEGLDEQSRDLALKMIEYMEKKCISIPMKAVKELVI